MEGRAICAVTQPSVWRQADEDSPIEVFSGRPICEIDAFATVCGPTNRSLERTLPTWGRPFVFRRIETNPAG